MINSPRVHVQGPISPAKRNKERKAFKLVKYNLFKSSIHPCINIYTVINILMVKINFKKYLDLVLQMTKKYNIQLI